MIENNSTKVLSDEILTRIEDLVDGNEDQVSAALALAFISVLNKKYKPDLCPENVHLIKENFPEATNDLMKERSLAPECLSLGIKTLTHAMLMLADYSPSTNNMAEMNIDTNASLKEKANITAIQCFTMIKNSGITPLGSVIIMISNAVGCASASKIQDQKLLRILLEKLILLKIH